MTTNSDTLPEGWFETSLGKLGRFRTGPFGSMLHKADYLPGGTPIVNPMHIVGGRIVPTSEMAVSSHAAAQLSDFALREGDVVIGRRGEMGRCAVVPSNQDGWLCGTGSMIIRCGRDLVPEFAQLVLSGPTAITAMLDGSVGSTMININQAVLGAIRIRHPAPTEQRAIACVISDLADLADQLDQLIAKKEAVKQGAMQQLLTGQTRLDGYDAEWQLKAVGEVGSVLAGKALAANGPGEQRPYLRTKNVLDGRIALDDVLSMPFTDVEFERFRLRSGDVLLNEGQMLELVGRCAMYRAEMAEECAIQNQLLRFRAHASCAPEYAEHLFRFCQKSGVFAGIATQTTSVAHLGVVRFKRLELRWPPSLDEQCAIAEVLTDMDDELEALKARRDKTQALKQGMMQELLSGRIRLV